MYAAAANRSRPKASRVMGGRTNMPTIAVTKRTKTDVGRSLFIRR